MITGIFRAFGRKVSFFDKLAALDYPFLTVLVLIASVGVLMLYSTAGGSMEHRGWAQLSRLSVGMGLLLLAVLVDIKIWIRLAYPIYILALGMLFLVEFIGYQSMGAQRWLHFATFSVQPSEPMKIALVLVLARYYHDLAAEKTASFSSMVFPLILISLPVVLLLRQPDLGTAVLTMLLGVGILFLAGIRYRYFISAILLGLASLPLIWQFVLHPYQQQRILTFLYPEQDPMGAGYHILQSKIALGSGGVFGHGYLGGTQNHLDFLPEKETDFIFTVLAEEIGLMGSFGLMLLYAIALLLMFLIAVRSSSHFGRMLAMGFGINFFLHAFGNIAMVTGLIPVVGMPLPLVSYGGSAIVSMLFGFGLVMNVHVHQSIGVGSAANLDLR